MCGIAGIIQPLGKTVNAAYLMGMERALRHRGPDDLGFLSWRGGEATPALGRDAKELPDGCCWLAHRRLSIIDVSDGGSQPMMSADGKQAIVFNGEIYNYPELRQLLEAAGHSFQTDSDTEVLLASLKAWGSGALMRLKGMFALAMLDFSNGTVLLARDPFGIKPLYYTKFGDGIAFASEIKALLTLPGVSRRANLAVIRKYLENAKSDSGEQTFFADIHQIPAAYFATSSIGAPQKLHCQRYWTPAQLPPVEDSQSVATEKTRELFLDSVRMHMRSDVPVGAALSGGVDSSRVVSAMRQLGGAGLAIHAFSFTTPNETFDEEAWIDKMSDYASCQTHKIHANPSTTLADVESTLACQDEPVISTSICAQHQIFQLAQRHGIKVTLDGQGADEYLAGYPAFAASALAALIQKGRLLSAGRLFNQSRLDNNLPGSKTAMRTLFHLLPRPLAHRVHGMTTRRSTVGHLTCFDDQEDWAALANAPEDRYQSPVHRHLCESLTESSLPQLLRYADRNAMASSVESRLPFLTTDLVDYVLSLPADYIFNTNGTSKFIFREAMKGLVPESILLRRDKIGFLTPQDAWLRAAQPWVTDAVQSASKLPFFRPGRLNKWSTSCFNSAVPVPATLWRVANLGHWATENDITF